MAGSAIRQDRTETVRSDGTAIVLTADSSESVDRYKRSGGYYPLQTVYGLVHQKKIPHVKFGHSVRFDPRELDAWMRQGRPEIEKLGLKKLQEMERTKFED